MPIHPRHPIAEPVSQQSDKPQPSYDENMRLLYERVRSASIGGLLLIAEHAYYDFERAAASDELIKRMHHSMNDAEWEALDKVHFAKIIEVRK